MTATNRLKWIGSTANRFHRTGLSYDAIFVKVAHGYKARWGEELTEDVFGAGLDMYEPCL